MAFAKDFLDPSGNTVNYFVIKRVIFDVFSQTAEVSFDGWKDQAAHDNGLEKMGSFGCIVPPGANVTLQDAARIFIEGFLQAPGNSIW